MIEQRTTMQIGHPTRRVQPRRRRHSPMQTLVGLTIAIVLTLNTPGLMPSATAADNSDESLTTPTTQTESALDNEDQAENATPSETPTPFPTEEITPTVPPQPEPTEAPLPPTESPTREPTTEPTVEQPTELPTLQPTIEPSLTPTTSIQRISQASVEIQADAILPLTLSLSPSASVSVDTTVTGQASWGSVPAERPTGTVQYVVYSGNGCTGAQFGDAGTQTIDSAAESFGTVAASTGVTFSVSGPYSWQATYSGDSAYAANAVCTDLTVNKATPTIALTLTPTSPTTAGKTIIGNAPLTNASIDAGGTVDYTIYTNNICTTQVTPNQTSVKTVTDGVVPASDPIPFNQVGTFYWKVVYSGDDSNLTASSSCVPLVVSKSSPSLTLTFTPSPVVVGNTATGTATLTNISGIAGGTVTYTVYTSSSCTTQVNPAQTSIETVTNGVADASDAFTFPTVGTSYWRAVYTGDPNSNGVTSSCTALTVSKLSPTLTIAVEPLSGVSGSSFVASTILTNATSTASGTVTYTLYSNNTCSTTLTATGSPSTKTVVNALVPDSTAVTLTTAATRYWKAVYGGDALNSSASSTCFAFTVAKASPTVDLVVNPTVSPMKAGGTARGAATLTGATTAAAGTLVYTVYSDSDCTTVRTMTSNPSTVTVANHVPPLSSALTFSSIGTFYWKAVYNGDTNNNGASSACIPFLVAKSDPNLALTITSSLTVMKAGGTASGRGTLTLASSTAGGTITYRVFTESTCTTLLTATSNPSVKTVTNRSAASSSNITITQAGTVYWQAVYGGDANNNGATSPCTAQSVAKSDPTLTVSPTTTSSPLKAAGLAYAKGTLGSSTSNASGTVLVTIYTDSTCTTVLVATGNPTTVSVTNKVIASSATVVMPYAGTVYWRTVYSGDINNNGATSSCVAQVVAKATPTLALTISAVVAPMTIGGSAFGKVTMTKATTTAAGALTYTVYSDSTCATVLTTVGNPSVVTVANLTVPNSASIQINTVGTVYWRAAYAGDSNHAAATSSCVSLVVGKTIPTSSLTVTALTSPMVAGGSATATLSLFGTTNTAGGTVTYTVYSTNTCGTTYSVTGSPSTKTVVNGSAPTSTAITFNSLGTFYWRAVYSGDTSNTGVTSACVALVVSNSATAGISLSLSPNPAPVDATVVGSATLAGTTATAGGTVTYTVYANSSCTTPLSVSGSPSTVTVTNSVVPNSAGMSFSSVGTRYWQAIYSGDANNSSASGPCAALTVSKTSPNLSLTFASESVEAGTGLTGTAVFTGTSTTAGGQLTYTVYSNNTCSTQVNPAQSSTVTVTNGVAPSSSALTVNSAGTAYWRASYVGDTNNNAASSPCTPVSVAKASATISLSVAPSEILVWESVAATATLSHVTASAGGTVVYTVYADSTCATAVSPAQQSTKTVSNGLVPTSTSFSFDTADTFYWQGVYSGDANNESDSSTCVALTVVGGALTASVTQISLAPVIYSESARTNSGSLVLTVTDQRGTADGWTVSLSVSDFAYSGPSPHGTAIDASSFSITVANGPVFVSGQAIDSTHGPLLPPDSTTGRLDIPNVVLEAESGFGAGVYAQTLEVSLVIPARSQAGSYTAVLYTVTSAAP